MNLCMRQMRCDSSFAIRWKTVSPLFGQSHRRKGRREQVEDAVPSLWSVSPEEKKERAGTVIGGWEK
jgi:hypothetical protein